MDIGSHTDIKNPADIESCSASLRILILGFKLQPNLIALCASLGPEVFLFLVVKLIKF